MKNFNESNPQQAKFKKSGDEALHGDVIVTRHKLPDGFDDMPVVKDACLAYGESTGHMHKIFGEPGDFVLREEPKTKIRHLHVVRPVSLKHQEHSPIILPPGDYRIGIQKEYNHFSEEARRVAD